MGFNIVNDQLCRDEYRRLFLLTIIILKSDSCESSEELKKIIFNIFLLFILHKLNQKLMLFLKSKSN